MRSLPQAALLIYVTFFQKIENISHLTELRVLDLSFNNIKVIEGLETLTKIQHLYLLSNKIKVIEGLDTLQEMEMLELGSNRIEKLENLQNLPNLKKLYLGKNKIQVIENLEGLKSLKALALTVTRTRIFSGGGIWRESILRALYPSSAPILNSWAILTNLVEPFRLLASPLARYWCWGLF